MIRDFLDNADSTLTRLEQLLSYGLNDFGVDPNFNIDENTIKCGI